MPSKIRQSLSKNKKVVCLEDGRTIKIDFMRLFHRESHHYKTTGNPLVCCWVNRLLNYIKRQGFWVVLCDQLTNTVSLYTA